MIHSSPNLSLEISLVSLLYTVEINNRWHGRYTDRPMPMPVGWCPNSIALCVCVNKSELIQITWHWILLGLRAKKIREKKIKITLTRLLVISKRIACKLPYVSYDILYRYLYACLRINTGYPTEIHRMWLGSV